MVKISTYNLVSAPDKEHIINIPSGNYNSQEFTRMFNNLLQLENHGLQYLICEISSTSLKTIIRLDSDPETLLSIYDESHSEYSPDFYYTIDFGDPINKATLGSYLGFQKAFYTIGRNDRDEQRYFEGYIECETSYGNGRSNYVFVSVEDFNKSCIAHPMIASTNQNLGDSVIGRIPITESFGAIMPSTSADRIFKQREYLGPVNIDKFRIKILDKYGNVIDLNNNDVSMALEITEIYSNNQAYTY